MSDNFEPMVNPVQVRLNVTEGMDGTELPEIGHIDPNVVKYVGKADRLLIVEIPDTHARTWVHGSDMTIPE